MILNRLPNGKFELPADGWFHLSPKGEFPGVVEYDDGSEEKVIQVVDDAAIAALVKSVETQAAAPGFGGILVDFDHFSHDKEKSSEAAGWLMSLQNRDSGLWGKIDLTDVGEAALTGGRYRFISPVWDGPSIGNSRVRPVIFQRAGLTNDPNLRGSFPLSNRAGNSPGDNQKRNTMKLTETTILSILALHGLSPESTDEQVTAALPGVREILNRGKEFSTLKTSYDSLLDAQAEADLDAHKIEGEEKRKKWKGRIIANRADALDLLKDMAPAEDKGGDKTTRIHNRSSNPTPKPVSAAAKDDDTAAAQRDTRITNRAKALKAANPSRQLRDCYDEARGEEASTQD